MNYDDVIWRGNESKKKDDETKVDGGVFSNNDEVYSHAHIHTHKSSLYTVNLATSDKVNIELS